jgi:hypothetical protein
VDSIDKQSRNVLIIGDPDIHQTPDICTSISCNIAFQKDWTTATPLSYRARYAQLPHVYRPYYNLQQWTPYVNLFTYNLVKNT